MALDTASKISWAQIAYYLVEGMKAFCPSAEGFSIQIKPRHPSSQRHENSSFI